MRTVMTALAVLTLMACDRQADTTDGSNASADNAAMDANAADANLVTPAAFQINETTWEFTREGKTITSSVDASGNYVDWSGAEHIDHGTSVMKGDKVCFTSAMDKEGEICWTTQPTEVGQSFESTNDKGEKVTVKRVDYTPAPDSVKP
ncbi:MAG TPA: hypothetical protein VNA29_05775 [Sphingomicrobium sp.]|nr:hypothetical protein [Sphingomicrobium sp.]